MLHIENGRVSKSQLTTYKVQKMRFPLRKLINMMDFRQSGELPG